MSRAATAARSGPLGASTCEQSDGSEIDEIKAAGRGHIFVDQGVISTRAWREWAAMTVTVAELARLWIDAAGMWLRPSLRGHQSATIGGQPFGGCPGCSPGPRGRRPKMKLLFLWYHDVAGTQPGRVASDEVTVCKRWPGRRARPVRS